MNNIKVYERNELKGIRSQINWSPGKFSLPPSTVFRIKGLNCKENDKNIIEEELEECYCQAR